MLYNGRESVEKKMRMKRNIENSIFHIYIYICVNESFPVCKVLALSRLY